MLMVIQTKCLLNSLRYVTTRLPDKFPLSKYSPRQWSFIRQSLQLISEFLYSTLEREMEYVIVRPPYPYNQPFLLK